MKSNLPFLTKRMPGFAASPGPDSMSLVVILDQEEHIGPDMRWPLNIAKLAQVDITLLVCNRQKNMVDKITTVDLSTSADQSEIAKKMAERMCPVLDEYLGNNQWTKERSKTRDDAEETGHDSPPEIPNVQLRLLPPSFLAEEVDRLTPHPRVDLVIFVGSGDPDRRKEWMPMIMDLAGLIACSMVVVVPGSRRGDGELMIAAEGGPHGRNAIDLAAALSVDTGRSLVPIYVEPDIGPDAEDVGHSILDNLMKGTLEEKLPIKTVRKVVINDDPVKGIIETCNLNNCGLLVLGATRLGALGVPESKAVPNRILNTRPDFTLAVIRSTVPLKNRLRRWLENLVQQRVPQLVRKERIDLVKRIQSSAQWNFDFILLIGLSTIIATLGLLDDSPAVIIGAMLVATLMTPLIGIGLSIAQGNLLLARMSLKAAFLGFVTAFLIACVIGFFSSKFHIGQFFQATDQMAMRDWPQFLDLAVAFVSGLAASYASGRSNLIAALPGVAIAAALVPPIATAGLAVSVFDFDLAVGALLLFGVNIVAIIIGASISLWALGIRYVGKAKPLTRFLGTALAMVTIIMALGLAFAPPLLEPPGELVEAVESALTHDFRLRSTRIRREGGQVRVQIDLGGSQLPDSSLNERIGEIVHEHLGEETGLRLTFRFEALLE